MALTACEADCFDSCNTTSPEDPSLFRRSWYSLAMSTILYTIWAGYTCVWFLSSLLFYWSRKIQPIKSRNPELVLLSSLGGYLLSTNFAMAHYVTGIHRWPCPFSHWSLWVAFPLFLFPFPARSLKLYLIFKRNVDKVKNHGVLQAKTQQRVTVVEQRFSMSANGVNGGQTDVQRAIEHHKQKKAQQKATKKKDVTIEENTRGVTEEEEDHDAAAPSGNGGQVFEESSGLKRFFGLCFGKKPMPASNVRQSVRIADLAAARSGIINTQSNRTLVEKYLNYVLAGIIIICFIIGIIRQFIPSLGLGSACVGCLVSLSSAIVQTIIIFIVLGIQTVSSVFIYTSQVKDQFKIGRELQLITVVWFGLLFPACILAIRGTNCEELRTELSSCSTFDTFTQFCYYNFAAQHSLIIGCNIITFFITICMPLFVTYHKGRKKLLNEPVKIPWPSFKALTSLKECLLDKEASAAFQKFCVQSFCVEQILFWKDVEQFRLIGDVNELRVRAVALYKRYIDASGALFVQLPQEIQEQLDNVLAEAASKEDDDVDFDYNFQVSNSVFIPAQMEVFNQMEHETFPGFLRSDLAKKLFAQYETTAASINALQEQRLL